MPRRNCRKEFTGKIAVTAASLWALFLSSSLSSAVAFVPPLSTARARSRATSSSLPNDSNRMQPCRFVIRGVCLHGPTRSTTAIISSLFANDPRRNGTARFTGTSPHPDDNCCNDRGSMANTRKRKSSRTPTRRSARSGAKRDTEEENAVEDSPPPPAVSRSKSKPESKPESKARPEPEPKSYKLLAILSPAKTLNLEDDLPDAVAGMEFTKPLDELRSNRREVVAAMKEHAASAAKLGKLLKTSQKITSKAQDYWRDVSEDAASEGRKPSIFLFDGAAYAGLDVATLATPATLGYLQGHLRIVDPLYGWLRPMDRIEAYRLEMASRGVFAASKREESVDPKTIKLEDFWKPSIRACIEREEEQRANGDGDGDGDANGTPVMIVNLASDEYAAAVDVPPRRMVKVVFKHGGRTIAVHAKRARGLMVRYMATRSVESLDQLLGFDSEGYSFRPNESTYERGGDGDWSAETLGSLPRRGEHEPKGPAAAAKPKKGTTKKKEQPLTLVFDRPGTWKKP